MKGQGTTRDYWIDRNTRLTYCYICKKPNYMAKDCNFKKSLPISNKPLASIIVANK